MGSLVMRSHCPDCGKSDLVVELDYRRYAFLIECVKCGLFGEIITDAPMILNYDTGNWKKDEKAFVEELHFRKVFDSPYNALKRDWESC